MAIFVVPKFPVFFEDLDVELPLITRITLGVSRLPEPATVLLIVVVRSPAASSSSCAWGRTPDGRRGDRPR